MTWKDGETISPLGLNRIEEAVASMNESYTPTVWEVGDLITAEKLNKIEEGIANAPVPSGKKEITSTAEVNVANYATAQVVDEDLVAGNIKKDVDILGVVGSYEGGGASDFSIAEVSIINNSNMTDFQMNIAIAVESFEEEPAASSYAAYAEMGQTENYNVILYKGNAIGYINKALYSNMTFTTSENIIVDINNSAIYITGSGTITIADNQ